MLSGARVGAKKKTLKGRQLDQFEYVLPAPSR